MRSHRRIASLASFVATVVVGVMFLNFMIFAAVRQHAFIAGRGVPASESGQPNVLAQKGSFSVVSPGTYRFIAIYGRVTFVLFLIGMAAILYLAIHRLVSKTLSG